MRAGRGRLIGFIAAGAVIVVGLGVGIGALVTMQNASTSETVERVCVEPEAPDASPVDGAAPLSVRVPVVDMDVEIEIQPPPVDGFLIPPNADIASWLDDRGTPGADADDTVYLLGHSASHGGGAFDNLVDRESLTSTLLTGDEIIVETEAGEVVYQVLSAEYYARGEVENIPKIWEDVPGRLVLVTCLFNENGERLDQNVVIYARLAPESSHEE